MDFAEAVLMVLSEEQKPLHWTVIQDLALKRGYLDPFTQRDIREGLLVALSKAARDGAITREGKGVYSAKPDSASP